MKNKTIRVAEWISPLGPLTVEWTEKGIRRIYASLFRSAETRGVSETPVNISPEQESELPQNLKTELERFFRGEIIKLNQFDQENWTDFQKQLYPVLLKVPIGETKSYSELAKLMGSPGAARAVGTAMRKNPIPLLIPCHRVLPTGSDALGNYSFGSGIESKARLLNFESVLKKRIGTSGEVERWWEFDWKEASRVLGEYLPLPVGKQDFRSRLRGSRSLFMTLARSIIGQQIHGRAADAIWGRMMEKYGNEDDFADASLAQLRACGVSENKARALQDLARAAVDGEIPTMAEAFFLSNEELIQRLTQIRGIGPWTVEMILIFQLGRGNVWPMSDFAVKRGAEKFHRARKPFSKARMIALGEKFAPYQTVASLFFWNFHGTAEE